jgi:tripartite-type tricarboxylate transporter receptor subunit TctC
MRWSILLCAGLFSWTPQATAQTVEEFYRGKTITMYIGTGESAGAVGSYPRAISQVIKKYIPGNPNVVVANMPGGGGIKAANFLYSIGPQDGTAWGFITRGFLLAPLLKYPQADFDPTKYQWIGSPARTVSVGAVWTAATPVRTIEEARRTELVVGATSAGQDTGIFPVALNRFIGTKFKVVTGYKSVGEVDLAMEKSEVMGKVGFTWNSLKSGRTATWIPERKIAVIVQLGLKKSPDIPADVPLALDLVATPEDRQALEVLIAPGATGYPSFMGPGVPKARVDAIRQAYKATMKDPEFVAALERQKLDLDPIDAEELNEIVTGIYRLPAAAVERARDLIPPG